MKQEVFLVTTALEHTWPKDKKTVLFLGEWCRLYNRKDQWVNMNAEVLSYHWDDRDKLHNDYHYLIELYERLLIAITNELNCIHKVNNSIRYWRILIGPWLMMFISIAYDRWESINSAVNNYQIVDTVITEIDDSSNIPSNMELFSIISKNDLWNFQIFSSILKYINFEKISYIDKEKVSHNGMLAKEEQSLLSRSKVKMKATLQFCSAFLSKNNNYFFIATYLTSFDSFKLQLKLRQMPTYNFSGQYENVRLDQDYRRWKLQDLKCKNNFERFLNDIIPKQLPLIYLEGYIDLVSQSNANKWPKAPKLIWTSNSYFLDDIFKQWAAAKVEQGVPLIIGQHGGHYGQGLFSFSEYHELTICDYYLSWGWANSNKKIIPIGTVKKSIRNIIKIRPTNSILLIISGTPRYSDGIASMPISSQWLDYMMDQQTFYEGLSKEISSKITVRLYPSDYNWFQYERWQARFPKSIINNGEISFKKQLLTSSLVISGWNTTTYLESMLSNIPTLIFWNSEYFELRDSAEEYFEQLKKVGIYHDTPNSAALFLTEISSDIDSWWNRDDVVSAKNKFLKNYVQSNNVVDKLSSVFKELANQY